MAETSTVHKHPTPPFLKGWIRGNRLHNLLLILDLPRLLPRPIAVLLVLALLGPVTLLYQRTFIAGAVLGLASLGDLALLLALPRLRLSFGPVAPVWILFAAGRAGAAAVLGALPVAPATELVLLCLAQLALASAAAWGTLVEPFRLQQTRLQLRVPGLAGPLRLLLLSDLHLERWTPREEAVLRAASEGKPDLILIAGDLVNLSYVGELAAEAEARRLLLGLQAPAGVFLVRGTAEVDPPDRVRAILQGSHVQLLEGARAEIGHGPARLSLLGLPADRPHRQLAGELASLAQCSPPRLCLHHTPDLVEVAAELGIELYLAGHTHGGQICLPLLGPVATASRFGRRYLQGHHRVGRTDAIISRGLGLEGLGAPRLRFLASPELVWITLLPE